MSAIRSSSSTTRTSSTTRSALFRQSLVDFGTETQSRERQLLSSSVSIIRKLQRKNDELSDELISTRSCASRIEERLSYLESAARDPKFEQLYTALRSKDEQIQTRDERIRKLEAEIERLSVSPTAPIPIRRGAPVAASSRARSSSRGPPDGPLIVGVRHSFSKSSQDVKSGGVGLRRSLNGAPRLVLSPRNKVN